MISLTRFTHSQHTWGINAAGNDTYSTSHIRPLMGPNISEDTDVLNVHCDAISDSLVDGQETDIVFSFGTGTLQSSYNFVMEPQRVFFNPVNKTSISSIRIYITDGRRRPVYLNHTDVAFSLILKYVPDF